jgi:hypothetical protein
MSISPQVDLPLPDMDYEHQKPLKRGRNTGDNFP